MIKEIIRIKYADSLLPESWVYAGGDKQKKLPIIFSVFLVIAGGRKILVDAGCETMAGFEMRHHITPMEALKQHGYTPSDITDIIITHADHDHIECVKYFPNATVHIQRDELTRGKEYLTANADVRTFDNAYLLTDGLIIRHIGGHTVGSSVVECYKDGTIYVLCGDECYSRYNLTNKVPTATSVSPADSAAFIEKYTGEEYTCLLCHEAE